MEQTTKKWYQSRTIIVAILTGTIGLLTAVSTQYPELGFVVIVKSILDIVLRFQTTEEIQ